MASAWTDQSGVPAQPNTNLPVHYPADQTVIHLPEARPQVGSGPRRSQSPAHGRWANPVMNQGDRDRRASVEDAPSDGRSGRSVRVSGMFSFPDSGEGSRRGWFIDKQAGEENDHQHVRHKKAMFGATIEAAARRLSHPSMAITDPNMLAAFRRLSMVHAEKVDLPPWRMFFHHIATESRWFDQLTLSLIMLNCVFLAMEDPNDECNTTTVNKVVVISEYFFAACFTIEMAIRIAGLGLYQRSFAYLRDAWNVLDAIIVVSGLATIATSLASSSSCSNGAGVSGLRAFRLLRPLRAVTKIKEVRLIVASLLHSLPKLGDVLLLFFFFILIFGIIAIQLWKGALDDRCAEDDSDPRFQRRSPLPDEDKDRVCGTSSLSGFRCPWGYICRKDANPNMGRTSFDNLAWTLLTLFVSVTMEGWTDVMYFVQDSLSWWFCLYFVVLILFGSFFVMNLVLVMIGVAYLDVEMQEVRDREAQNEMERVRGRDKQALDFTLVDKLAAAPSGEMPEAAARRESSVRRNSGVVSAALSGEVRMGSFHSQQSAIAREVSASRQSLQRSSMQAMIGAKQRMQQAVHRMISTKLFMWAITATILLNTLFMAIEHHGQPDSMTKVLEVANYVFTGVFALESSLKIASMPWEEFVHDRFNVFDAVIAVVALVDVIVLQQQTSQQTGVSVLRTFRLMRMFKLAKQFPTLWATALTIIKSVEGVSVITLLLILLIFIYALLGKQFFGGKFCNLVEAGSSAEANATCILPRSNFDHLGWATISVFQVITGEDWNVVMYHGMCVGSNSTTCSGNPTGNNFYSLYFVSLFILGNYVMLNLFIAVLISNFSKSRQRGADAREWTEDEVYMWLDTVALPNETEPAGLSVLKGNLDPECNKVLVEPIDGMALLDLTEEQLDVQLQIDDEELKSVFWTCLCALRAHQATWEEEQKRGCSYRLKLLLEDLDRRLQRHDDSNVEAISPAARRRRSRRESLSASPRRGGVQTLLRVLALRPSPTTDRVVSTLVQALRHTATRQALGPCLDRWGWTDDPPGFPGAMPECHQLRADVVAQLQGGRGVHHHDLADCALERLISAGNLAPFTRMPMVPMDIDDQNEEPVEESKPTGMLLFGLLAPPPPEPFNVALCFLPSTNCVRVYLRAIVMHSAFEAVVIMLILLSTAALAMNDPIAAPDDTIPQALDTIDLFLTVAFDVEAVLKIVAHGFLLAPESYLRRDAWNRLDFIIVIVSNVSWAFKNSSGTENLALLRMMRTLRPLRFINRFPGLKLVVVSLIKAIPPLANIFVVTLLVFVIFGIMGVQFFSGSFAKCSHESWGDMTDFHNITREEDCVPPYRWESGRYNYDSLLEALIALFQISTLEGWVAQMHLGMDAVSVPRGAMGRAPEKNKQPWMALYFVVFIVVGCFFIVNLFIGVLIEQYNSAKNANDRDQHQGLTEDQKLWVTTHELILANVQPVLEQRDIAEVRLKIREHLVNSPNFERLITVCIVVNVCFMGSEHEGQTAFWASFLDIMNWIFIGVFTVEAVLKCLALTVKGYFEDNWNRFDFSILALSLIGAIMAFVAKGAPVLSVFRALRLGRLTRVIRTANGVRRLLRTLWLALPGLANVAGLLLLFFFLYAVVGVVMFGRTKRGDCMNDQVNFDSFGNALLLLFRMSTGEAWQCIMFDCEVQEPYCDNQLGNCGSKPIARVYFISFIALTFHVLLQVFIAIILSDYENVTNEMNADVTADDINHFTEEWNKRDPRGTRLLPTCELPLFIRSLQRLAEPPLGLADDPDPIASRLNRQLVLRMLGQLCSDYGGYVFYQDVLLTLVEKNVLAKKWQPELGMDVPDRAAWQARLHEFAKRWRLLGYRRPRAASLGPSGHGLAALRIQTCWRAKKGRERALAHADTVGKAVTWRMHPQPQPASPVSCALSQGLAPQATSASADSRDGESDTVVPISPTKAASPAKAAAAAVAAAPAPAAADGSNASSPLKPDEAQIPLLRAASTGGDTEGPPPLQQVSESDVTPDPRPAGAAAAAEESLPPKRPSSEDAQADTDAVASSHQRAQPLLNQDMQGGDTPSGNDGQDAAPLPTSIPADCDMKFSQTTTTQARGGTGVNITIHNINNYNIQISGGQTSVPLPPELVAELQRHTSQGLQPNTPPTAACAAAAQKDGSRSSQSSGAAHAAHDTAGQQSTSTGSAAAPLQQQPHTDEDFTSDTCTAGAASPVSQAPAAPLNPDA
eukprot:TRINITY_DN4422_c0_g1_i1.p1 TRINITY_DN4422_c0_g1~~TRINITY_DN4422_c0_g1_i1.p1  ORF type:complete len:2239 (+),score=744.97 TRINITY_DN4422_c0_g1_i1:79-6717(+)